MLLLNTITAKSYIQRMDGGVYTQPHLIKGNDGRRYVLKIPPQHDGRSNLNEYLGCRLGDYFELSMLAPVKIKLTEEFVKLAREKLGDHVHEGEYFGTLEQDKLDLDSDRIRQLDPKDIINQKDIPKFIIFDILVHNIDRHSGNYFLITSPNDSSKMAYILIDHSHIFGGPDYDFNITHTLPYLCPTQPWNLIGFTLKNFEDAKRHITKKFSVGVMNVHLKESPSSWRESYGADNILAIKNAMTNRDADKILEAALNNPEIKSSVHPVGVS